VNGRRVGRLHIVDVGAGPPVVLLAGFGLDHEVWDSTVPALLGAGFRAVAPDLRGTGQSDKPDSGYAIDDLAGDVAEVLDTLDLTDVRLVGYSFGGQIGLRLAATRPDRLSRLILLCSHGVRASRSDTFPFGPPPDKLEAALVRAEQERGPEARRANVRSGFRSEPDPAVVDRLVAAQLRMPSSAAIACYHTYLHTDLTEDLTGVTVPVLQILGADDPVTPAAGAAWVQERVEGDLNILQGCGHYPMFEASNVYEAALLDFVT
jgi:pimeloyl-ACP methyl ester carboxylesterase